MDFAVKQALIQYLSVSVVQNAPSDIRAGTGNSGYNSIMDPELQRQVTQQRTIINETLRPQTVKLAIRCRPVLGDREALERILQEAMPSL